MAQVTASHVADLPRPPGETPVVGYPGWRQWRYTVAIIQRRCMYFGWGQLTAAMADWLSFSTVMDSSSLTKVPLTDALTYTHNPMLQA